MSIASILNRLLPESLRPVALATRRYQRWSQLVVQAGPFRGMRYVNRAHGSQLAPKLAGSYEKELHPFLPRLFADRPDVFVDVGAAEGYYAVGAAFAGWCDRIIAFEIDPDARAELAALRERNGLPSERIELRGGCTAEALAEALQPFQRPAVIMDVEGFEALLLDPVRVPPLGRCRLLVEYHDFVLPGLSDELRRRLAPTHAITAIALGVRTAGDLPCSDPLIRRLPAGIRRRIVSEHRPFSHHGWLWMEPACARQPA